MDRLTEIREARQKQIREGQAIGLHSPYAPTDHLDYLLDEVGRLTAERTEAIEMARSLCPKKGAFQDELHMADILENHVFRSGQMDSQEDLDRLHAIEEAAKRAHGLYWANYGEVDDAMLSLGEALKGGKAGE